MASVLLIVGGGIAAYKSLELVRLLKQGGASVTPVVLTEGGAHFVTADEPRRACRKRGPQLTVGSQGRSRDRAYPAVASADMVLVRPPTADLLAKDGRRDRRRSRDDPAAGHRQAGARRAGDERAHVAACRDPAQCRAAQGRWGRGASIPTRARWRAASSAPAACPSPTAIIAGDRAATIRSDARGQAYPRHRRPDARADRPGALSRQPLVGKAGLRHCRRRRRARGARDAGRRPGRAGHAAGRRSGRRRDRRANGRRPCRPPSPPMPRSWSRRSRTGCCALGGQAQEGRGPPAAAIHPNPRHPGRARRERGAAATPRRLRRRDRARGRTSNRQAAAKNADWIVANDVSGQGKRA